MPQHGRDAVAARLARPVSMPVGPGLCPALPGTPHPSPPLAAGMLGHGGMGGPGGMGGHMGMLGGALRANRQRRGGAACGAARPTGTGGRVPSEARSLPAPPRHQATTNPATPPSPQAAFTWACQWRRRAHRPSSMAAPRAAAAGWATRLRPTPCCRLPARVACSTTARCVWAGLEFGGSPCVAALNRPGPQMVCLTETSRAGVLQQGMCLTGAPLLAWGSSSLPLLRHALACSCRWPAWPPTPCPTPATAACTPAYPSLAPAPPTEASSSTPERAWPSMPAYRRQGLPGRAAAEAPC